MTPTPPQPEPDHRDSPFNASIGAIILIAIGAVLFLDNLGLVPFANIRDYWPLAISAWGIALLSRNHGGCGQVWPWTMIAIRQACSPLGNLHIIRMNARFYLAHLSDRRGREHAAETHRLGLGLQWSSVESHAGRESLRATSSPPANASRADSAATSARVLVVAFGGVNRRIDSPYFRRRRSSTAASVNSRSISAAPPYPHPTAKPSLYINASFGAIKTAHSGNGGK